MKFDIEEFYPPISKELLQKGINVIMHNTSRKFLLFSSNNIWIKKNCNPTFDAMAQRFAS